MNPLLHNPLLWLLAVVPVVFAAAKLKPDAQANDAVPFAAPSPVKEQAL